MDEKSDRILNRRFDRAERMLPAFAATVLAWLRRPRARWIRVPVGMLLLVGGVFSVLPGLGIWMLPLGVILLAIDVPFLKRPSAWMVVVGERWWRRLRNWWRRA